MDANSRLLREAFDAALAAARPERWLAPALAGVEKPGGCTLVVSLGKASVGMARVFADCWDGPFEGLAVTPRGTASSVKGFRVLEAAHPVPDSASAAAGEAALTLAAQAGPDDLVLVLLSGGASALACAPIDGVSLAQTAEMNRRLLASGVDIHKFNAVRRPLSRLKGGGLLRAAGEARVVTLAQSDVPFDELADIGSGPGVPSPTGPEEALSVLAAVAPDLAGVLAAPLRRYAARQEPVRARWSAEVAFGLGDAAEAAAEFLERSGQEVEQLGPHWGGDAVDTAKLHVFELGEVEQGAVVSGGETTVAVPPGATGRGGRNLHFLLALAIELAGRTDVWALAADTDGIDGTSSAAGAWFDPDLLGGLDVGAAEAALDAFDSHGFFEKQGRLIETGPTGVNVGDLRILLVA